jgi:UDP-galactopyranose mutase
MFYYDTRNPLFVNERYHLDPGPEIVLSEWKRKITEYHVKQDWLSEYYLILALRDYLVVGSGLFGAVFAREATDAGKKVLVIDKRPNIAGNIYTEKVEGINFHKYGAHIFHTNNTTVWNYVNRFATFNRFTNSPVANYKGELYSMPFNMYTFNQMWGVVTPEEAAAKIEEQKKEITGEPRNLEEQAISLVGRDRGTVKRRLFG